MRGKVFVWGCAFTLLVTIGCSAGGEKRHFAGTWEPPPSLLEFWAPIDDSWWKIGDLRRIDAYCKEYAKRSDPVKLLPEIIKDLKKTSDEARVPHEGVYILLASNWDRNVVMSLLAPYAHSSDLDTRMLATDFIDDLQHGSATPTPSVSPH